MLGFRMAVPGSSVLSPRFGHMCVGGRERDVLGADGEIAA